MSAENEKQEDLKREVVHDEQSSTNDQSVDDITRANLRLQNPLSHLTHDQVCSSTAILTHIPNHLTMFFFVSWRLMHLRLQKNTTSLTSRMS